MQHKIKSWKDDFKTQYFCEVCRQDNPSESSNCPGPKRVNVGKDKEKIVDTDIAIS